MIARATPAATPAAARCRRDDRLRSRRRVHGGSTAVLACRGGDVDGAASDAPANPHRLAASGLALAVSTLTLASTPAALAGGYGTGLKYFEALERERAVSEEAVPLSQRDGRRANQPPRPSLLSAPKAEVRRERGVPLSLGASDDISDDDSAVQYSDPGNFAAPEMNPEAKKQRELKRWGRAAFQWGVIAAIVANVRAARNRGSAVTARLGLKGKAGRALIGSRWKLTLDIGRERGTWMPPGWGASGRRILVPVAVELREGGVVEPIAVGAFLPMTLSAGKWRLEGDALKFDVAMSGMTRGDIELPEDSLHFRTAAWGSTMASRGNLLLRQTRFGFRREWRTVGVFKAEPLADGEELESGDEDLYEENRRKVVKGLGTMRVSERRTEG